MRIVWAYAGKLQVLRIKAGVCYSFCRRFWEPASQNCAVLRTLLALVFQHFIQKHTQAGRARTAQLRISQPGL